MDGRKQFITVIAMCVGSMVTFLQITASVSSLGAVGRALEVAPATLVWVPSAYTLAVAALVLSAGTLGSRFGRRRMFRSGAVVLALGAAIVVVADSLPTVIVGQLVAGVGGALILPNSLAIVAATFPDPHRRTEVITLWAASSGIGLAVGPIVSGVLLDHADWHFAFTPAVVLGAVAFALTFTGVAETRQPGTRLDPTGLVLGTVAVAALVYGMIEGGGSGYTDGRVVASWILALVAVCAFVAVELRVPTPMLDVRLFRSASFATISAVAAIALFGFTGLAVLQVLFYERVQSLDALATGYRVVVIFAVYVAVAAVAGRLVRRVGFVPPLAGGLALGAVAALGLLTQTATTGFELVWFWFALFGAGVGLVAAPSTAAAMVSVDADRAGMASGAVNAARQIGSVLGSSTLGAVLTSTLIGALPSELSARGVPEPVQADVVAAVSSGQMGTVDENVTAAIGSAFTSGVHTGLWIIAAVFGAGAVATVAFVRNRPHVVEGSAPTLVS
ncbi:MFS transporter [Rhodococcoides trifolii]|uniref:MFS transporter n=1 Tax=Rhodococcoides trifolii TaxID=908250 RepID=A0A917LFZ0_9NOCA|nr:MFS transporter [Rhodococcus trifolii]GGG19761.1 MFS transporter [Rhodococcus trifolii]